MTLFQFSLGWPQLIWLFLCLVALADNAVKHGKPKTGDYNVNHTGFGVVIGLALLWWGGFFGG